MTFWILLFLVLSSEPSWSIEVHFEASDSGFFLKHSPRQPPVAPKISNVQSSVLSSASTTSAATSSVSTMLPSRSREHNSVLSVDRFTVVQTTQPVSIRASYGPFSTKQTVPARYIVPDAMDASGDHLNNTTAALMELQQTNLHLDISAHLVRHTIPRDAPVLRVLFHAGADPSGHLQRQKICVLLYVSSGTRTPLKGRCMPEGEDGVCLAEVVIPASWWPQLPPPEKKSNSGLPKKVPQRLVHVSYSVFEPPSKDPELCEPKVQIQPLTSFVQVPLVAAQSTYKDLRADDSLTILIPQNPLYPMSKIHVPVFLHQQPEQNVAVLIVRARVKIGVRILGASVSSDQWNISVEKENPKHTVARVTAFRKEPDPDKSPKDADSANYRVIEVFSWLLEITNDTKENWEGGKIVWSVSYVYDSPKLNEAPTESTGRTPEENRRKLIAKIEINKDDIQAVLPISKNSELMNTAVLTGRQISQALKVFIVSQAGKIADVTLQSSCQPEDESVIKVSSSCSSVYVDGSEIRGSSNASIKVKYGTYVGLAKFIVWMPEFPLEVYVSDFRLSQIKGWKVPDDHHYSHAKQSRRRKKRSVWSQHGDDLLNVVLTEKALCRSRYQQSPVDVYARFLASDQNSGRVNYLISRRTGLRVTDLVQPLLRVADPKIASLNGRILQGKSIGRTDIQVLSPITGRVIGAKEVRVGSDKVTLTRLIVRVVSGLQLTITSDSTIENGYIAETSVTRRLTAQYQEGLLDIDLEFSDGTRTPLRDISADDYFLLVESLDTEVVAFAPMLASHHPRVIAVGEGNGDLLRVTLLLSESCRLRRSIHLSKQSKSNLGLLASTPALVQVDFNAGEKPNKPETVQNDGIMGRESKSFRESGDLADIIVGIPLKDASHHYEPTVQARLHRGGIISIDGLRRRPGPNSDMTTLEIGMYVLLAAFCFAIIVFVISCVVYASKYRPFTIESGVDSLNSPKSSFNTSRGILHESHRPHESTINAHDWVWLGRSTMDRSSFANDSVDSKIRITSNPILNCSDRNNMGDNITTFENQSNSLVKIIVSVNDIINSSTNNRNEKILSENSCVPSLPNAHGRSAIKKKKEYRPPVPPHRNIGVTAHVNNKILNNYAKEFIEKKPTVAALSAVQKRHYHKHQRSANHHSQVNSSDDLICCYEKPSDYQTTFSQVLDSASTTKGVTQQQASPEHTFSPHEIGPMVDSEGLDFTKLHMAERLVENAVQQQQNVFQFDSLMPKVDLALSTNKISGSNSKVIMDLQTQNGLQLNYLKIDENTKVNRIDKHRNFVQSSSIPETNSKNFSADDNGIFVTSLKEENKLSRSQVKHATVVGNPMFIATSVQNIEPDESLGLDDFGMDYEQIMHYFDNLKESNA